MTIIWFEELIAVQKSRVLTKAINETARGDAFRHDVGLAQQIQRAAVWMTSNVVESFERNGRADFLQRWVILVFMWPPGSDIRPHQSRSQNGQQTTVTHMCWRSSVNWPLQTAPEDY